MFQFYFNFYFPLLLLASMEGSRTELVSLSSLGSGAAKAMPDSDFAALQSQYDALLRDHEELKSYALGTPPFLVLVIACSRPLPLRWQCRVRASPWRGNWSRPTAASPS